MMTGNIKSNAINEDMQEEYPKICTLLRDMLQINEELRPDFIELQDIIASSKY